MASHLYCGRLPRHLFLAKSEILGPTPTLSLATFAAGDSTSIRGVSSIFWPVTGCTSSSYASITLPVPPSIKCDRRRPLPCHYWRFPVTGTTGQYCSNRALMVVVASFARVCVVHSLSYFNPFSPILVYFSTIFAILKLPTLVYMYIHII